MPGERLPHGGETKTAQELRKTSALSSVMHQHHASAATTERPCAAQYAFNLFSHNAPMQENGYNEEEMKMVKETHKIWRAPDVAITATCIRVPIMRAHAESINLELENELSEDEVSSLQLLPTAWYRWREGMCTRISVTESCARTAVTP